MDDVLFLEIIVQFNEWNDVHHRGLRVEVSEFSARGGRFRPGPSSGSSFVGLDVLLEGVF